MIIIIEIVAVKHSHLLAHIFYIHTLVLGEDLIEFVESLLDARTERHVVQVRMFYYLTEEVCGLLVGYRHWSIGVQVNVFVEVMPEELGIF